MKQITLLGATGSIGIQTLEVIRLHPDHFSVYALAFGKNIEKALPLIKEFSPKIVVVQDKTIKKQVESEFPDIQVLLGTEGMIAASTAADVDVLVNAVMGSVGLPATLAAIEAQKVIAIANKETLVTAGHLVMEAAYRYNVDLLPVDSEHSAIFQSLNGEKPDTIERLVLTASGGSFRDKTREELKGVTVEDALNHPNWSMGAKITVDSASMMNKGLEVIEAHWLFHIPYEQIDVILHRESVIHSMVEYKDRSVIAQLGTPDMKVPIQYALTYPDRLDLSMTKRLNLEEIATLHFQPMDYERFRCLKLAYQAGKEGGSMTTVLNAANEQAVELFLNGKISFLDIETLIEQALESHQTIAKPDLETIIAIDQETRSQVCSYLK
ncbi:1-deoxy-D-xylulose 5-phosphate reductoisomerase 2 [Thalassobacillus devorans]|uniref:1-deoxy-D-xylulose 5-phosphate reductoisomerase n=1 Tax=Thalassobacillus devorans TaxID=279813 RepID=A0ABQ1P717_9BACI|nr:1-deoxy-D-xylulose-5-phosphate reductoisomerase [Thalassobacillus devorans]NIK27943.1 1-deoxy-D-xylulose-5-phosphate reductoisomerase [Thalassobacillus devorans]GGC90144.1 1-deoxy-D-xylulose 5-phosphate reductoisomerase 2 [Thalassobacillus devorans]